MALEKYKICPVCGEHNSPSLLECRKCEADLTGVKVTDSALEQQEKEEAPFSYVLQAVGDEYSVTMDRPVSVIGREAELQDYLADKMYVSRQHAKLTIVAGKVLIENLSNTNRTFINNTEISQTEPTPLTDGDEIGLGGIEINGERQKDAAYFLFKVKS